MTQVDTAPRRAQRAESLSKGDRRERDLVEAANRMLNDGSFGAASISEIAGEAGLSRASFYFYFASKQALLAKLLDDAVGAFNVQIASVVASAPIGSPSDAVRATVDAASDLWWQHSVVLKASVELGAELPDVYERTMENFAVVGAPTVELLRGHGTVPEAADNDAATALVTALMLMSERNYYHLMRGNPTEAQRDALTHTLQTIWLRSFGLDETLVQRRPTAPRRKDHATGPQGAS